MAEVKKPKMKHVKEWKPTDPPFIRYYTDYPGVYVRMGKNPATDRWEKIFYLRYVRDGRRIEEKAGRERADDMSASRASKILGKISDREQEPRREQREAAADAALLTFDGLWKSYQEWRNSDAIVAKKGPWSRQESDQSNYTRYLQGIVGSKTTDKVTDADIERINGKMARTKGLKGNKALAPATRRMILALLVRIATYGTEKKRCAGLTVPVELPAVDNVVTEFLTKEETARLGAILQAGTYTDKKGVRHEISRDAIDLVYILLTTGMRRGEILGIEWRNVDLQAGTIFVPYPKERRSKTIHIHGNPIVADILESRKDNGSKFVFPARDWKEKDAHIVDPKRSLNLIKKAAALPSGFRCGHGYRHNFGYWAVMPVELGGAGADVVAVGATMGHASIKTTERYITAADLAKKRLSNRMAAIFAPKELPANVVSITKVSS